MRYFEVGKIVNVQGVKGEVRVLPMTDDPDCFTKMKEAEIFFGDASHKREVERARAHKQFIIIKFKDIHNRNQAESLRGGMLKITKEQTLPPGEDEYYIGDLYDMEVFTLEGEFLGVLVDILQTGANDVYVVQEADKKVLIPAIKQCINRVNVSEKKMYVTLLEGLREV